VELQLQTKVVVKNYGYTLNLVLLFT